MPYKMTLSIVQCLYHAAQDMLNHDGLEHAGYLSFLFLMALFPSLFFLMTIISELAQLIGNYDTIQQLIDYSFSNLSPELVSSLTPRIREILYGPQNNFLTLAFIGAIWTSSSALEGIKTVLNRAYRISEPPHYIIRRLFSILQFFVIIFFLIILMLIATITPIILKIVQFPFIELLETKINMIQFVISFILIFLSISMLYALITSTKVSKIQVFPGAFITTMLWSIDSRLLSIYVKDFSQMTTIYGGLAGIIVTLLFFYTLSVFFIYGAEVNYHISYMYNTNKK